MRFVLILLSVVAFVGIGIQIEEYLDNYGYWYVGVWMVIFTLLCEWPHKDDAL